MKKIMIKSSLVQQIMFIAIVCWAPAEAFVSTTLSGGKNFTALRHSFEKEYDEFVGLQLSFGGRSTGRNHAGWRRNVLQMHNEYQSALDSYRHKQTTDLTARLAASPVHTAVSLINHFDDNKRGFMLFSGRFQEQQAVFFGMLPLYKNEKIGQIQAAFYFPCAHKYVDDIAFKDLGTRGVADDAAIRRNVTQNPNKSFPQVIQELGGLDLSSWRQHGLGDISAHLRWRKLLDLDADKVEDLALYASLGIELPTSKIKNEDKAFSMPMGNDGAWAIPMSASASYELLDDVYVGVDADLKITMNTARERRMKTNERHTEFLLFNKGDVVKKNGLAWSLEAHAQWRDFFKSFSWSATYQFQGKAKDFLKPRDTTIFPQAIVNSARSLQGWRCHSLQFQLSYDYMQIPADADDDGLSYHASLFYKLPFASRNLIDGHVVGGQMMVKF